MLKQFLKYLFTVSTIVPNIYSMELEMNSNSLESEIEGHTSFVVRDLYARQRTELSKSSIYFFVTAYEQEKFAPNLARSLKLNYDRLRKFGVDFQIRLICDGRVEDLEAFKNAFLFSKIPSSNFTISLNQKNKGCSLTRYEQLLSSKEEIMKDISSGKHVYFSIFDGDDIIHKDYCILMLSTALETDADIVGIEQLAVKCWEKDLSIINTLRSKDISHTIIDYKPASVGDFCTNLFKAFCIYNSEFNFDFSGHINDFAGEVFNKNIHFVTLDPLVFSDLFKSKITLYLKNSYPPYSNLFSAPNVSDIGEKFIPMFFYMQHPGSQEHSPLKTILKFIDNQDFVRHLLKTRDPDGVSIFFGIIDQNGINDRLIKTSEKNIDVNEEFLIERFKNKHLFAHTFKEIMEQMTQNYNDIEYLLNHPKTQELLAQDISKPLSDDFVKTFYRDVFDIILGKKPNPDPAIETINEERVNPTFQVN